MGNRTYLRFIDKSTNIFICITFKGNSIIFYYPYKFEPWKSCNLH